MPTLKNRSDKFFVICDVLTTHSTSRLFMHGGHTNHLADFSWNPNEPWLVASAAEDNLLQIWKVAESIVGKDDGDLPVDELDR